MADLENHFGDDASLDVQTNKNILDFLIKNSAENSSYKASWNFLNSINAFYVFRRYYSFVNTFLDK